MSSRRSSSRRGEPGGGGYYPTQWSAWEWNTQYHRYSRYRLKGPDDYEYEYEQKQAEDYPRTNPSSLDPIVQPSLQPAYTQQTAYTTAPAEGTTDVDNLVRSFSQTSLGPGTSSSLQSTYTSTQFRQSEPNYITTRNPHTSSEEFDPHYKVHGYWEFKWGRVFKVLWTEPKENGGRGSTDGSSTGGTMSERPGQFGETYYEKVRRFVVINAMEGHCICLPIMTYGGQGVNKRGVHAKYHTIIYTNKTPVAFKGEKEKGLTKKPIRVEPSGPRHKLDLASRLNYAKLYTVEYNVKVWFIGKVHSRSEWQLGTDYNRVHPPLESPLKSRGLPQDESCKDNVAYSSSYLPTTTNSSRSSYRAATTYSPPTSFDGVGQSLYSPILKSGGGGSSAHPSQPLLDPVDEAPAIRASASFSSYGHSSTSPSRSEVDEDENSAHQKRDAFGEDFKPRYRAPYVQVTAEGGQHVRVYGNGYPPSI